MLSAKVIAVDDDPVITHMVRARLESAGIACDVASSAEEALTLMRRNLYFVVVTDIHMPGMSGVELISALKEVSPLVQIIMLTVDACVAQVIQCAERGAVDFLSKDGDYNQIVVTVGAVLARRQRWAEWLGRAADHSLQPGASASLPQLANTLCPAYLSRSRCPHQPRAEACPAVAGGVS